MKFHYKSEFLVLQGGFDVWLVQFPDLSTNPSATKSSTSANSKPFDLENEPSTTNTSKIATTSSSGYSSAARTNGDALISRIGDGNNASVPDGVGEEKKRANFFYPKLENFSLRLNRQKNAEPLQADNDDHASEEIDVGFHRKRGHHSPHLPFANAVPEVNRATKPSALSSIFKKKDKDASKASLNSKSTVSSSAASLTSMDSTLSMELEKLSVPVAPAVVPAVNRDTKPAELLASFATAKSRAHRLEEQYVDEMRVLKDKEEEWAKLAMEKRYASEESMRLMLQKREEQLLEDLSASEKQREQLVSVLQVFMCRIVCGSSCVENSPVKKDLASIVFRVLRTLFHERSNGHFFRHRLQMCPILVSASCVTISNRDSLSSSEIEVNPGMKS